MPFAERTDARRASRGGLKMAGAGSLAALALVALATVARAADEPATAAASPTARVPSAPAAGRILDGVVAVVDGDPITLGELKRYGVTDSAFLPPDVRGDFRALLDTMIEHRLLKTEFEKNGIVVPDEMVERYIASVLEEKHQTRGALEADVSRVGISWKDYFERMREEVQRIQLMNLLIRSRVNVPEEEVRKAWEADPQYLEEEKREVSAIFLPLPVDPAAAAKVREDAVEIRKKAGSDFEAAARKYSKGPGAADGGRLGEFRRGAMAAHFEKALSSLSEGEVSEPVEAAGGLFLVKLGKTHSAGRKSFEEVKEALTDKLYEHRLGERYQKWATEDLRKDHRIEILLDRLAEQAAGS